MTRDAAIARAHACFDSGDFERDLARLVAIPTESQTEAGLPHCRRYLSEAMEPAFAEMGFDCRIFDNPVPGCGPVLLAERHEADGLPTILGYGHGDVIRGLEEQWTKGRGPWQAAREGDRLYGRGTADNKGQHWTLMQALKAVLETRGRLGFNAKFLIETGEENGSKGLREVMETDLDAFRADVFIASDGPRVRIDRPTVSLGARGAMNFDLVCHLREGGHHSGNWGGALADPAALLAHAIACIVGPTGRIEVPQWRPAPPSPLVRELLADVTLDPGPDGPVPDPGWGEPGFSPAENVYAWNSFAVLAMISGNPSGPVNAIAPWARAHCQLRYIAGTDTGDILPALRRHLDRHGHHLVAIEEAPEANRAGYAASRTEPDNPWVTRVRESVRRTTGQEPAVLPQMGGSICNELFTDLLGIPAIWIPHSYAGCSQHAPDEHIILPMFREALGIMAGLYWDLGEPG
ncbi:MAG: M20 peptidase family dipeptidase [Alphaproteobacteria bacterium]|nr:MAG: M20 peptidase family dipeptidase [Alphaproteobacteria bacterium]